MGKSAGDAFAEQYEAKLKTARDMASISCVMYGLNWFLGVCALTWASAVILGGFLTYLTPHDYFSVVALLLLEALRLSTTTFFGFLVTRKLVHGSTDPARLVYDDTTRQNLVGIMSILEQAMLLTAFAISILVPIRRLKDLNVHAHYPVLVDDFQALKTSLRIFYVLVLVNGVVAGLAVIFSKNVMPLFVDSFSLRRYYEKIVWKGMDEGLLHATDFELLSWTFEMQADEYRSNTRALVVKELYGDMIKYLYFHPRHKGFEAAKVALESNDTFEREAAANIVGLWVVLAPEVEELHRKGVSATEEKADCKSVLAPSLTDEANESDTTSASSSVPANANKMEDRHVLARLFIQTKLLAKLAEALDSDESGRAASSSFLELAKRDPKGVLMLTSEGKHEKVVDILMDRIHWTVEMGKPKNALLYIKAIIPLLSYLIKSPELHIRNVTMKHEEEMTSGNGTGKNFVPAQLKMLKKDMWIIVSEYARGLKRLQVVAAHVYDLLLSEDEREDKSNEDKLHEHLRERPEGEKQHILKEELEYLSNGMPNEWGGAVVLRPIKEGRETRPLPFFARPTTALVANLVSLVILAISSIFIMRYAHF